MVVALENVYARLITRKNSHWLMTEFAARPSMLRRRKMNAPNAPKMPKIAPDAPSAASLGALRKNCARPARMPRQIDRSEAPMTEQLLDDHADEIEREHVQPNVRDACMQEHCREQAVPLQRIVLHQRADLHPVIHNWIARFNAAAGGAEEIPTRGNSLGQIHQQVDDDQAERHDRHVA